MSSFLQSVTNHLLNVGQHVGDEISQITVIPPPKEYKDASTSPEKDIKTSCEVKILQNKIKLLEKQLTEANLTINSLQNELKDEKTKHLSMKISVSSTSDDTKKHDSSSFEKLESQNSHSRNMAITKHQSMVQPNKLDKLPKLKTMRMLGQMAKLAEKRASSTETQCRLDFNKLKTESEEDIEFQKDEVQAMYEAKIEQIIWKKTKKELVKETLKDLKSPGRKNSGDMFISNDIDSKLQDTMNQNQVLREENERLQFQLKNYKMSTEGSL